MKFTRTLALALAAAAALTMTACDDDEETTPAANLSVVNLSNVGTQKHAADPSFISIRFGATYKSGSAADQVQQNREKVDIVVFADSASPTKPSFYSPKRMTERFSGTPSATLFSGITTDTKFVRVATEDFDETKTASDLSSLAGELDFGSKNDVVGLALNDVVVAKLVDNTYALVKVTAISANGDYNVGVQLKYAK